MSAGTALRVSARMLPTLIAGAGDRAALRFLEFFTVNIRNKNTGAAYARAAAAFLRWCEGQGLANSGASSRCMWPRIFEQTAKRAFGSLGQTTSGLYPYAVRLARHRAWDAIEAGHFPAFGPQCSS